MYYKNAQHKKGSVLEMKQKGDTILLYDISKLWIEKNDFM